MVHECLLTNVTKIWAQWPLGLEAWVKTMSVVQIRPAASHLQGYFWLQTWFN